MNALIVDDERIARQNCAVCFRSIRMGDRWRSGDGRRGRSALGGSRSISFLDIKMPGVTGVDLLERLERVPLLVFTTACDEFVFARSRSTPGDYLLKPVRPIGRRRARQDAYAWMASRRCHARASRAFGRRPGLSSRRGSLLIVTLGEIVSEAEGNYARVPRRIDRSSEAAERARVADRSRPSSREPPASRQPPLCRAHRQRSRRGLHRPSSRRTPVPVSRRQGRKLQGGPGALAGFRAAELRAALREAAQSGSRRCRRR